MKHLLLFLFCMLELPVFAQFEPAAGMPGSTAIHKDSSVFVNWAKSCTTVRGMMDMSTPSLGMVSAGTDGNVIDVADGFTCVSLGDGGSAICEFPYTIQDEAGADFAVFENSFVDYFLELAFVEVSSDGIHYFRFPSQSLTDTSVQVGTFDSLRTTQIHNLAGKYTANYGTPFDLADIPDTSLLDKHNIRYVKVIDVVGSMQEEYASRDSYGRKINDPWPTPFATGGFDLEAIGVIHQNIESGWHELTSDALRIAPSVVHDYLHIVSPSKPAPFRIYNQQGTEVRHGIMEERCDVISLASGLYILQVEGRSAKFIKQ